MFSIDTQFFAPQNSFHTMLHVWKATCVRGFHVYQDIQVGRRLQESLGPFMSNGDSNAFDLYTTAIRKSANVIRHVTWKISAVCSLFIERGGRL